MEIRKTAFARAMAYASGELSADDNPSMVEHWRRYHEEFEEQLGAEGFALMPNWRPIKTAPMDASTILAYFPLKGLGAHWCRVAPVFWSENQDRWVFAGRAVAGYSDGFEPTHWMPLPLPPVSP